MKSSFGCADAHDFSRLSLVFSYLIAGILIVVAAFLFAIPAHAQEAAAEEPSVAATEEVASSDVAIDTEVTHEELELTEATILPGNPLYGFKRFGRAIREAATFNPVKKAELELRHASQELIDAKRVVEENPSDDAGAARAAARAIGRFEGKMEKISNKAADFAARKQAGDTEVDGLLDKFLDKQLKQQKILDTIGDKVTKDGSVEAASAVLNQVQEAKDASAEHVGAFVATVEPDSALLAERFDRMLATQAGSEFKDIKNLEVLKRLETKVPQQARDAIQQAQENAFKRFTNKIEELGVVEGGNRFEKYVKSLSGEDDLHMEIFDQLKGASDLPTEFIAKVELAKDVAAQKFETRLEFLNNENFGADFRARAQVNSFKRFTEAGPDLHKMRALDELQLRMQFDNPELEQAFTAQRDGAVDKFKEVFADPESQEQAESFRKLAQQMGDNPDPTTFRLLGELGEKVKADPTKRAFIEKMETHVKQNFAVKAQQLGDEFFTRVATANPQDIEVFKGLQRDFAQNPNQFFGPSAFGEEFLPPPPLGVPEGAVRRGTLDTAPEGFLGVFEKAVNAQTTRLTDHLKSIDDPRVFENFQAQFQSAAPEALREIQSRNANFSELFKEKRQFAQDARLQEDQQNAEKAFKQQLQSVGSQEDRAQLQQAFSARQAENQKQIFDKQLQADPFCDAACQARERSRFEGISKQNEERFKSLEAQGQFPGQGGRPEVGQPQEGGFQFPGRGEGVEGGFPGQGQGVEGGFPAQGRPQVAPQAPGANRGGDRAISDEPAFQPRPEAGARPGIQPRGGERGISDDPVLRPRPEGDAHAPAFDPSKDFQVRTVEPQQPGAQQPAQPPAGQQQPVQQQPLQQPTQQPVADQQPAAGDLFHQSPAPAPAPMPSPSPAPAPAPAPAPMPAPMPEPAPAPAPMPAPAPAPMGDFGGGGMPPPPM